jgi:hypothetical protein
MSLWFPSVGDRELLLRDSEKARNGGEETFNRSAFNLQGIPSFNIQRLSALARVPSLELGI